MKKELGVLEVFSISAGAMISSGLFVLPAVVYSKVGPSLIIAYLLSAVFVIPAIFSKAELATAMPKSGGVYFFIYRSFGPLFGTFAGFASWFSLGLKSSFALVGMGIFLQPLVPEIGADMVKVIAVGFTLVFTVMNILSVKESGRFQVYLVFSLILIILLYVFLGMGKMNVHRFVPFNPEGWWPLFTVIGTIFVSYGGLTKVASVAEEVRNPGKTLPLGMFSAFIVVTILYVLVVFVTIGLLNKEEFQGTLMPISLGASKIAGNSGFVILAVAAMIAFITTANAGIMAASRSPLAMANDNLLPSFIARVNVRLKTPVISILITSLFMVLCIIFLDLERLVKVASTMKLILFTLVNLSVIMMRESRIVSYKPAFKSPLYPYLQIAGIVVYLFLIIQMGRLPLLLTLAFFLLSLLWYLLYSKSRNRKESALVHIVERITSREMKSKTLPDELRDILVVRDDIVEDRFDRIMRDAIVVDVESNMDMEGLFKTLSSLIAGKFNMKEEQVFQLLMDREKDSTTVIHKGLAIPHIVIEGESEFDIVVVRSRRGISFGENVPPVHIVFALAGTGDERNFHLQSLMAIAQIVQNNNFLENWIKVKTTDELKNLIFLAERVRKVDV